MALTVKMLDFGVDLSHKGKSVFLPLDAWKNLVACCADVQKTLEEKEEKQWTLDDKRGLRAHVNTFNDKSYAHVRSWWNDRPTKRGVAFCKEEWDDFKAHLNPSLEMELGMQVMKKMMEEKLTEAIKNECEGCVKSWGSQRDHECLMDQEATAKRAMTTVSVLAKDFIEVLAKKARKENLILEVPHETYKRIRLFHLKTIERELLKDYE